MAGEVRVDPQRHDRWIFWEGPLFTMRLAFDAARGTSTLGEGAAEYTSEAVGDRRPTALPWLSPLRRDEAELAETPQSVLEREATRLGDGGQVHW
jgi:hypothetical protein